MVRWSRPAPYTHSVITAPALCYFYGNPKLSRTFLLTSKVCPEELNFRALCDSGSCYSFDYSGAAFDLRDGFIRNSSDLFIITWCQDYTDYRVNVIWYGLSYFNFGHGDYCWKLISLNETRKKGCEINLWLWSSCCCGFYQNMKFFP